MIESLYWEDIIVALVLVFILNVPLSLLGVFYNNYSLMVLEGFFLILITGSIFLKRVLV